MTAYYTVMGSPILHSLSPVMYNAAFQALSIDAVYEALEVNSIGLADAIAASRKEMRGFNVTAPHKEVIVKYMDELDASATTLRAVNTVTCVDGRLLGANTDVAGFANALAEENVPLAGKRVVVLGTGGAARAVVCAAVNAGAKEVVVAGRRHSRAIAVCEALCFSDATNLIASSLRDSTFQRAVKLADILVQATSVMPQGDEARGIVETLGMNNTRPDVVAVDLAYGAKPSLFCDFAKQHERRTFDGRAMLVHQGALAFELFTQQKAPIEAMRRAVEEALTQG